MTNLATCLAKLRQYEVVGRDISSQGPTVLYRGDEEQYAESLQSSAKQLESEVQRRRARVQELRQSLGQENSDLANPNNNQDRIKRLHATIKAYHHLRDNPPLLPKPESPLPALLAVRSTIRQIAQTKGRIRQSLADLDKARGELAVEDQCLQLARSLADRSENQRSNGHVQEEELREHDKNGNEDRVRSPLDMDRASLEKSLRGLVKAFNKFVSRQLSVMLLAEDMGGPVVGQALDLQEGDLEALAVEDAQRRSDPQSAEEQSRLFINHQRAVTAAELRDLVEQLLNAAADHESTDPYVVPLKDNAAVRLLVRAKIAQRDNADPRRLRLVNFAEDAQKKPAKQLIAKD